MEISLPGRNYRGWWREFCSGRGVSLTKYASRVTIVHQFDHFQAFEYAIEEARNNPSIRFILSSTIAAFHGNEKLQSVDIKNLLTGELHNMPIDGVFVFIGYVPNTEFLRGKLNLNEYGEILVMPIWKPVSMGFRSRDAVAKRSDRLPLP
jgi:thioredoxin reductase (NADPH)